MSPEDWRLLVQQTGPVGAILLALLWALHKGWLITGHEAREINKRADYLESIADRFLKLADFNIKDLQERVRHTVADRKDG